MKRINTATAVNGMFVATSTDSAASMTHDLCKALISADKLQDELWKGA